MKKVGKVNPVAKYSRNKSGAGAHKDKSKYDRKKERHVNMLGEDIADALEESVANKLDRLILLENMQTYTNSPTLHLEYQEEINKIREELENVDI